MIGAESIRPQQSRPEHEVRRHPVGICSVRERILMKRLLLLSALAVVLVAPAQALAANITVSATGFAPASLTINQGDTPSPGRIPIRSRTRS